jgi:hypothetical protein
MFSSRLEKEFSSNQMLFLFCFYGMKEKFYRYFMPQTVDEFIGLEKRK